jgi:hypothetical protein
MECTNCGVEEDTLVALVNDRRLCPACVKVAADNELIEWKLRSTPEHSRIMMERYAVGKAEKAAVECHMCRVRADVGVVIRGSVLCLACSGRWREDEMKSLLDRLGDQNKGGDKGILP